MLDVIVPLKSLAQAKSRLAPLIDGRQRQGLVRAMAEDLLEALARSGCVRAVHVLHGGGWDPAQLRRLGARPVAESDSADGDLNARLEDLSGALAAPRTLILHGDLPHLQGAELTALDSRLDGDGILLCPDRHGIGTNAIAYGGQLPFSLSFGADSFCRHSQHARACTRPWGSFSSPGFADDIDSAADLLRLASGAGCDGVGRRLRQWLDSSGIAGLASRGGSLRAATGSAAHA